jgi:hypothetical protein
MSEMRYGSYVSHLSELVSKETTRFLVSNGISHSTNSTHSTHSRNPSVSTNSKVQRSCITSPRLPGGCRRRVRFGREAQKPCRRAEDAATERGLKAAANPKVSTGITSPKQKGAWL